MAPKVAAAVLALGVLAWAEPAHAKALYDSRYTYEQTFGTTLRLVKVDLGLEVTESNAEWGYLLFVYTDPESGKRENRSSFSFVRGTKEVQVSLQVPDMPSYHEQHILDRLKKKLEEEHGAPPERVKKKPRRGADDDEDRDKDDETKPDEDKDPGKPDDRDEDKPRKKRRTSDGKKKRSAS